MRTSRCSLGLLCVLLLASCNLKVNTAAPPEFPPVLSSGISYTNYIVPAVPWSIHVARLSRSNHDLEIHCTHARGRALGLSTLSEQIRSFNPECGTPVAAVNGDFYVREKTYAGDPRGLQVLEGELISAPVGGVSLWIDPAGAPHASTVVSRLKVTWPNGATTSFGLNEERRKGQNIVLYTPALGRSTHTTDGIELILEQDGEGPGLPLRIGALYTTRVREVRQAANTPLATNTLVLSIAPGEMQTLPTVETGAVLKLSTQTSPGLEGVKTAISGGPLLVHEGRRQRWGNPPGDGPLGYAVRSMTERHPRTAVGWDEKNFYLIEVDGRQKISVGMTLNELADFMISMGCKEAVNFDGGGSAMFWCNGRIVNSPCDKREREIANALVVVKKTQTQAEAGALGPQPATKLAP